MIFHKREAKQGGGVIGNPLCKWQVILFAPCVASTAVLFDEFRTIHARHKKFAKILMFTECFSISLNFCIFAYP